MCYIPCMLYSRCCVSHVLLLVYSTCPRCYIESYMCYIAEVLNTTFRSSVAASTSIQQGCYKAKNGYSTPAISFFLVL